MSSTATFDQFILQEVSRMHYTVFAVYSKLSSWSQVMRGHSRNDLFLGNGKAYKQHPLFSTTRDKTLEIMLYFDELEVCNPLGSKAKLHKVGKLYKCL